MYTGRERQARIAFAFKSIFWFTTGLLGMMLTWLKPALSSTFLTFLLGVAGFCAVASIGLDLARRGNVVLWTLAMLLGGAAILGVFSWIYQSYAISPPGLLFKLPATPTP